ncbi:MAG: LlaJI family restriction endonuclease [Spirosomaceae bacterium]|jgi:hypothetical protein|nr:LlaJI family restriction endonuclease [Spirosomataceae bacterium]
MIVLFESARYTTETLRGFLGERFYRELNASEAQIDYVGYYYQAPASHSALLLPKVFLKDGKFAGLSPTELLDLQLTDAKEARQRLYEAGKSEFLFRFGVWLYQAIKIFGQRHPDTSITESADLQHITQPEGQQYLSELEVISSLLRFHHDNPTLFTFIKRYNSSQRHQVSWPRTVQKKIPVLQNGQPLYVETINKQKNIDSDEELFVLFFSVLEHLNEQYGFKTSLSPLYATVTKGEFQKLLNGQGVRRLREIRGKYFSDKMRQLWQLLYAFFARAERTKTQQGTRELLLVRDFDIVFEDMIDALLTDSEKPLPRKLKEHKDGKALDHIYEYASLLTPEDTIYHIGDSKYYQEHSDFGETSVYKQYTYARNVIQLNIDLLNDGKLAMPLRYRDNLTEGYNITPNFFISALVNDTLDFKDNGLSQRGSTLKPNRHFSDRLFDRDTLILQAYNINFLYVLANYVSKNKQETEQFRQRAKQQFRARLMQYLAENYAFWKVTPQHDSLETFVTTHFQLLNGKMYRPAQFEKAILVALEKNSSSQNITEALRSIALVETYSLA